jgi:HD-GYP domain-containing protein (c-di-GMP phosphodiesterase class II)
MDDTVGSPFFESIRRNIKVSYFVASIIPLGLLVYLSVKYILPLVTGGDLSALPLHIGILLFLAVVLSVLGLSLSVQTTNKSIFALQTLHRKLNSLLEITKQFRETPYLDLLLENIIRSATDLIYAETGSLLLFKDEEHLVYKVVTGKDAEILKDRTIKVGSGFAGQVAKTARPLLINKVDENSGREMGIVINSALCVPLIYSKKVIGVIELLNKKGDVFTREDERLLHSLADQAAISISQSRELETRQSDLIHITEILISAQDGYSKIKKGHARRVARYANLIARKMGLGEDFMKTLYYACLFHDIGFLRIPVEEQGQRERIFQHPRLGYEMIKPISLWSDVAEWILYHHERYDGRGYPSGKKGEEIPLGSRIIFVADTFDVLTSKRSYKDTLSFEMAIAEIEANSGSQFDPEVVNAFKSSISETDIMTE